MYDVRKVDCRADLLIHTYVHTYIVPAEVPTAASADGTAALAANTQADGQSAVAAEQPDTMVEAGWGCILH